MSGRMTIRPRLQGSNAVVLVLLNHEMETGLRKDGSGKLVPAWHITEVSAAHNGKTVITAQWGPAVSKNPLWRFTVKGVKAGDRIAVSWRDNRGGTRTDEAVMA